MDARARVDRDLLVYLRYGSATTRWRYFAQKYPWKHSKNFTIILLKRKCSGDVR
jgi:hypothetical protein